MRRIPLLVVVTALAALLSTSLALASPPSGVITFRDLARARIADPATISTPAGTDVFMSSYTMAPGPGTGWRTLPGPTVLALRAGKMAVVIADGCAAREYTVGQAAVLPAGLYQVTNTGTDGLEFVGVFLHLRPGGPRPLVDGDASPTPPGCAASPSASMSGPVATLADTAQATFGDPDRYAAHAHGPETIGTQPGKDVLVTFYHLEPGASVGWHTHDQPYLAAITKGTVTYYEGHDGHCQLSGRYSAGDAYSVIPGEGHKHLAVNDGDEPAEGYVIYLNTTAKYPVPLIGNQLDANDFSSTPPPDCPRLRDPNL